MDDQESSEGDETAVREVRPRLSESELELVAEALDHLIDHLRRALDREKRQLAETYEDWATRTHDLRRRLFKARAIRLKVTANIEHRLGRTPHDIPYLLGRTKEPFS